MYDTLKYNSFCRKTLKYDTFCRETLKYGTFCRKNLDYALRAKKMANLRGEPTPHFMLLWYGPSLTECTFLCHMSHLISGFNVKKTRSKETICK